MDAIKAIMTRRSIRKFDPNKLISDEVVRTLLEAAMNAPSASNQQPWYFIIIDSKIIMNEIINVHPFANMLKEAPMAILVCGNKKLDKYSGNWILDCSAATENILIAANALGLGSVWVGVYPTVDRVDNFKRIFNLPPEVMPLSLIALGYTDKVSPEIIRFSKDRVYYNKWELTKDSNNQGT